MSEKNNIEFLKFRKALQEVFKGENGKLVKEFLRNAYVDVPVISEKSEHTFYRLGQKEFVQGLLRDIDEDLKPLEKMVKGG